MFTASGAQLSVCLHLTQAIGRSRSVEEIYEVALDALREGLGVERASILLFDPDGVMRFKAYRGLSDGYRQAVEGHTPWTPDSHDAEPFVVADVAADPGLAPYLPTIQAECITGMAFIPLISRGRVTGKFMLYFDLPRVLGDDELQLARLIASQVAFAVERTRTEDQARRGEARLRFALDVAHMGTWDWDLQTNTLQWSENLARVHGLDGGAFDGTFQSYEREIHPDDRDRVLGSIQRAIDTGAPHDVEYRIVAPDGTVRWVEGKGHVERDEAGRPIRMTGVCLNVSQRKRAELARLDAVHESQRVSQQLAAIVQSSGEAIIGTDLSGVVTSWNAAAERMFGYPAGDVIGRNVSILVAPEHEAEERRLRDCVARGDLVEFETVRQSRSGRSVPVSMMMSPIRDADGRVTGASETARDISERKRADAEREQLHQRLGALVAASSTLLNSPASPAVVASVIETAHGLLVADAYAVWLTDPVARAWRMADSRGLSPAFAGRVVSSHRGVSPTMGVPFTRPLAVGDVAAEPYVAEHLDAYRAEGIRSMLICPLSFGPDRSGALVFYFRSPRTFGPAEIETGEALANLTTAAMTTADLYDQLRAERNAAEAARSRAAFLADATALLAQSLDYEHTLDAVARLAVPDFADWCAVDVVDDAGQLRRLAVQHVDPAKMELARTLLERYPPDQRTPGGIHEVVRSGKPAMLEQIPPELVERSARDAEHLRTLRELALTSYLCIPLVSGGRPLGALTFVYAESGRRYSAADVAFGQELGARAALAMENAFAYRQVQETSRVKDEFLATLSHELRTPLNAILGYAQMLSGGVLTGEGQTRALSVLFRNAEALKQIIDDVLDVARITSGKLRLSVKPLVLAEIVTDAVATIQPAVDAKGLVLDVQLGEPGPVVRADPDRLQQIMWNLLSNAVKFTERGGHVRVHQHQRQGWVELSVTDSGQGIDPAFLPHVFERFRQADGRSSREHAGLGLGLAIVRELTELHGGTVTAASAGQGTGATFTVRLPTTHLPHSAS